ncbi:ADP-glyceromanno-heptose 6-epimerase [Limnoglobus roseus]|uniref:ADP-L-glycero-D-manno-heptose-6-epimerase n=1 Tax=Limnoglobus roseus TaxID=2598579 RepID=A0A5C1A917_9BACT|nr:ADP-glyceromanno-heptose 6-epimerase [Limnoglobus roseus]QEL15200.1 ADP-glyceromanno-heptose 6-epimerase [Limnoglobus roseus]
MIVITGAAGFIGSNLAHRLKAEHDLLLVDHPLTATKAANFVGLKGFTFLEHDAFLQQLEADRLRPDAIFHLGACSATTEMNWDYLRRNNVEYTQRLWTWCATRERPFLYASSAATYGDGAKGFDDRTPPTDLTPLNLYGKSKNDFDIWALEQKLTPPRWAGLKFFNVFGPRESHKGRMASVAFQTYKQILATGGMKLFRSGDPAYADGGQLRDFVFVDDCVNHMLWLWKNPHPGGVFNSGTGQARSFFDLAKAVFVALGREPNISFIDMPADLAKQYQNYTQAETAKLRGVGCNVPATSLEDAVRKYVAWLEQTAKA